MKTVGIIGGLGPETTSTFYLELILYCQRKNKVKRPTILIYSVPITYKLERDEITKGRVDIKETVKLLVDAAQSLENGGAEFLVMPCNSLHIFIDKIKKSVAIPVLNIVEETIRSLKKERIIEAGIISTRFTRDYKLYENALKTAKIKSITLNDKQQVKIDRIILNLTLNKYGNKDKREFRKVLDSFVKKGIHDVILACTDLQLLKPQHPRLKIYDTMKILADATVQKILS